MQKKRSKIVLLFFCLWHVCWLVYFAHTVLLNNLYTKVALGCIIPINLMLMLWCVFVQKRGTAVYKMTFVATLLIAIFAFYWLFAPESYYASANRAAEGTFGTLKLELFAVGSLFSAVYFSYKRCFTQRVLWITALVVFGIALLNYYAQLWMLQDINGIEARNVNNMTYDVATAMIMIPFIRNRYVGFGMMVAVVLLCTAGLKRGAFLVAILNAFILIRMWLQESKMGGVSSAISSLSSVLQCSSMHFMIFSFPPTSLPIACRVAALNRVRGKVSGQLF